jgi:Rps23 Pro-64 3,4-dihydroxylase Tpa1-like proline 4-hydroxylase
MITDKSNKIVLKNAVPEEIATEVRQAFLNADYDKITQERTNHYRRELLNPPKFPDANEIYTAEFYRSNYLEKSDLIKNCFQNYIKPLIEQHSKKTITTADLRVYKMLEGGHYRIHKDNWMATTGFVWYLNKDWKWDWGGLLIDLDMNNENYANITIPEFNQLVIMNHQSEVPHLVTQVTSYAQEPRLTLVGFLN